MASSSFVSEPPKVISDLSRAEAARWFADEVQPHELQLRAWLRKQYPKLGDVDDVVQDSFLHLLKARATGSVQSTKGYLFGIARHLALRTFRRSKFEVETSAEGPTTDEVMDESADVAEWASLRSDALLAAEAIKTLPARCREIFVLKAIHGLSYDEIALRCKLSPQTVRVQMARGVRKCVDFLRSRGIEKRSNHP